MRRRDREKALPVILVKAARHFSTKVEAAG
jgi:hypothetical protein